MKASELKTRFIIKSEENGTNDAVSVSNDRFVQLINEAYIRIVEYYYEKKNEDDLRYIQELLVDDFPISKSVKKAGHQSFSLPKDYLEFSNVWATAGDGKCQNQEIELFEIKDLDRSVILNDENNSPSFKYREAPFNFASNTIRVFTNNEFNVEKIYLSYYRYPRKITLLNPNNPESPLDDTYDVELDEKVVNRVIDLALKEFDINNGNERFQANQLRTISKP